MPIVFDTPNVLYAPFWEGRAMMKNIGFVVLIVIGVAAYQAAQYTPPQPVAQTAAVTSGAPSQLICKVSDFAVEGFKARVFDDCKVTPCPALKLTGKLKNNCTIPAGAHLKITAEDKTGQVVDTVEGWPASIRNIAPGDAYAFDLGPLMRYRKNMSNFKVQVIDVRTWR
jgi:hypothetical protein